MPVGATRVLAAGGMLDVVAEMDPLMWHVSPETTAPENVPVSVLPTRAPVKVPVLCHMVTVVNVPVMFPAASIVPVRLKVPIVGGCVGTVNVPLALMDIPYNATFSARLAAKVPLYGGYVHAD